MSISAIGSSGNNIIVTLDPGSASGGDGERLFRWAEFKYPQFFPGGAASANAQGYTYCYYPGSGVCLSTRNARVIVHNGRDWNMLDVGALADFLATAGSDGY